MTRQEASTTVSLPLQEVHKRLRAVETWPRFMIGIEEVTKTSYERYLFRVRDDGHLRDVEVCAQDHGHEHRVTWHQVRGPAFSGEFRLTDAGRGHTRVHLALTAEPAGFLAALSEMFASSHSTAELDLQQLEAFLHAPSPAG